MDATVTLAMLTFVAFCIPIIGALWRIFSVREALQTSIANSVHRLDLLEQKIEYMADQQELALNGLKEMAQHVRDRSARAEEKLGDRLGSLERYLDKNIDFSLRSRD